MYVFRDLVAARHVAILICAAALALKILVPTGYMIGNDHGRMTVALCSGAGPATVTMTMPGMAGEAPGHDKKGHGKGEQPCAFAGLSAAMMGVIDPIQLLRLIAFVMALGLAVVLLPMPAAPAFLRPPLRGPPSNL